MELSYKEVYQMNPVAARLGLVKSYERTGSISATARDWNTSRLVVRKWLRRYQRAGEAGLLGRLKRPHHSPRQTRPAVEELVRQLRKETGYGRKRLAWELVRRHGLVLSSHTIRHILRRNRGAQTRKTRERSPFYPAHWAWSDQPPWTLVQVDTKDIMDKQTLGTTLWTHVLRCRLPRYQWTRCEAKSRLRFLAVSRQLTLTNGLAFFYLVMLHLRSCGISNEIVWQTDWGEEFGGSNPSKLNWLQEHYFGPLGARLGRYPKGRKEYNGRVERSHRTDDEEFYIPCLGEIETEGSLLRKMAAWVYFYNLKRPHQGAGMEGKPPFVRLQELLGRKLPRRLALLPPVILDTISSDITLQGGNDVLATYNFSACATAGSDDLIHLP